MKKMNMQLRSVCSFITIISVLFLIVSCANIMDPDPNVANNNFSATSPFSFQISAVAKDKVEIRSVNGPVEIVGVTNSETVEISGEKIVESESEADARAHLKDMDIQIGFGGDGIQIESIHPKETYGRNYSVAYQIKIPASLMADVDLTNGAISVDSLFGNVIIDLTNGNINLQNISGNSFVDLTNGQIDAKITLPKNGTAELKTTNGIINLQIPKTTSANLLAQVTNGNVQISGLSLHNMNSVQKKVTGVLGMGEGSINLKTTNGNINVTGFE